MQTIKVKTGFGYYTDSQGHVIAKAQLPAGDHELSNGLSYTEVQDKAQLDAVQLYIDPADIEKQAQKKMIADKTRQIAVDALIAEGKLPPDFEKVT